MAALEMLGGHCVCCGATEDLEFDHIDPATKCAAIGSMWLWALDRLEAELHKCQLLCRRCHGQKTLVDKGQRLAKGTHGTLSTYRYCKCARCRAAKSKHNREYHRNVRTSSGAPTMKGRPSHTQHNDR